MNKPRVYVYRGTLPLWLLLAIGLPVGALFLTSLLLAGLVVIAGAAAASLLLPRLWKSPRPRRDDGAIELDPSQYRRVDDRRPPR